MRVTSISDFLALDGLRVFVVLQDFRMHQGTVSWTQHSAIYGHAIGDGEFDLTLLYSAEEEIGLSAVFTTEAEAISHQFMISFYGECDSPAPAPSATVLARSASRLMQPVIGAARRILDMRLLPIGNVVT